jgi:hypothetical protein
MRSSTVVLVAGMILGSSSARVARAQMGEAEMAEALDRLGEMLGLPPVSPDDLKRRVAKLGGLDFRRDVPVNFMTREELSRYLHDLFAAEYPVEFSEREARMLRGFGLLAADQDLRRLRENVLNENIAGFYDERPGVKKLFAISSGRSLNVLNQLILSHELRHSLQDQYVTIRDKLEVESDYDDRRLAALCLFEGDASLLMEQYLASGATQNHPELAGLFQVFSQSLSGAEIAEMFAGPALKEAPPIVQEQLIAPYFEGRNLAVAIYEKGGFTLLNEKLRRPPRSMEQVLHPKKYLEGGDEPVAVALSEAAGGAPSFEGTLGELLIRVLLRGAPAPETPEAAAEGWGGDRYAVLGAPGGFHRLVWRSAWDTEPDAREFEAALASYAAKRFAGEEVLVTRSGKEVFFERKRFR